MSDGSSGNYELTLPSELKVLERVDSETLKYSGLAGFDEGTAGMIAMAAIEAVTNAVMHGNRRSGDKKVIMRYEWAPGRIVITVSDEGEGFDLTCVLDPTDPERCLASSGRGIYIMREIMDTVDFDISSERGTTVTMVKET
jgi:serine/threonine-protein kinase RsbW